MKTLGWLLQPRHHCYRKTCTGQQSRVVVVAVVILGKKHPLTFGCDFFLWIDMYKIICVEVCVVCGMVSSVVTKQ